MRNLLGGFAFPLCFLDTLAWLNGFDVPKESLKALSARPGVFPCDFGAFSVCFGFRGPVLVLCFRFGLVASPSPSVGFPFGPFWPWVSFFSCCPLASSIFSL